MNSVLGQSKSEVKDITFTLRIIIYVSYLTAIIGAELAAVKIGMAWGVAFYFVILFALIFNSSVLREHHSYRLFTSLRLIPIMRIAYFGLPLSEISQTYQHLIVAIPILVGVIVLMRFIEYSPRDIGLTRGKLPWQLLIACTGAGFGFAAYLLLEPNQLVKDITWQTAFFPSAVLFLSLGLVGELTFRGIMQHSAAAADNWGWIYIAILYAAVQLEHLSLVFCILSLLQALFYGWVVQKGKSLLGVILAQGAFYIGLYMVFPSILT